MVFVQLWCSTCAELVLSLRPRSFFPQPCVLEVSPFLWYISMRTILIWYLGVSWTKGGGILNSFLVQKLAFYPHAFLLILTSQFESGFSSILWHNGDNRTCTPPIHRLHSTPTPPSTITYLLTPALLRIPSPTQIGHIHPQTPCSNAGTEYSPSQPVLPFPVCRES